MNNNNSNHGDKHMHNYIMLRRAVGIIAISLPIVLIVGNIVMRDSCIQVTISEYYHTAMQDVFVGSLCAIGLFMFFYVGYRKKKGEFMSDDLLGNLAGLFAISTALFPTSPDCPTLIESRIGAIHNLSAILLLACLVIFLYVSLPKLIRIIIKKIKEVNIRKKEIQYMNFVEY